MDSIKELRIYRLAFRLACERLALILHEDSEQVRHEITEQAKRLEQAAGEAA